MAGLLLAARYRIGPWPELTPWWRAIHLAWLIPTAVLLFGGVATLAGVRWRQLREPPAPGTA
jgi:hypothetical protein